MGLGHSLGFAYMADLTVKDEVAPGLHDMRRVLLPPSKRFWTVCSQRSHCEAPFLPRSRVAAPGGRS